MGNSKKSCQQNYHPGDLPLSAIEIGGQEYAFLTAVRFFCLSFASTERDAWVTALLCADNIFPGPNAAEKIRRSLDVLNEMRMSRQSSFRFSNPRCECCAAMITQDERYLVQVLQNIRNRKLSAATSTAMLLCEGNDSRGFLQATRDFCATVWPDHQSHSARTQTPSKTCPSRVH